MKIDLESARKLVEQRINESWGAGHSANHGPLIVVGHIEKPYGWIFFYTAKKYWETGDISHAIAGNGPIIVEKSTGTFHQLGTATPPDEQVREWEKANCSSPEMI
jgi:hypothetical protein